MELTACHSKQLQLIFNTVKLTRSLLLHLSIGEGELRNTLDKPEKANCSGGHSGSIKHASKVSSFKMLYA